MNAVLVGKGRDVLLVVCSVLAAMLFVAYSVRASTTISTNVDTAGTLAVTSSSTLTSTLFVGGVSTLSGFVSQASSSVVGLLSSTYASSTVLSLTGNFIVNGNATTTSAGAISTQSTLAVTSSTTLAGLANVGGALNANGGTVVTGSAVISGTASSTNLRVGADQNTSIAGLITGFCTFPATNMTASTTIYVDCTGATGVTSNYHVLVQATSSLPGPIVVQSASSSVLTAGTITLELLDTGLGTTTAGGAGPLSVWFWAFR